MYLFLRRCRAARHPRKSLSPRLVSRFGSAEGNLAAMASLLHLWACVVGIALQPISTASGNIGFVIALTATIIAAFLQGSQYLLSWRELCSQLWFRCLVAWLIWSWISLAWSSDRSFGVQQFKATRVLLWIPMLWPLRHKWWHLVTPLLCGTIVMQLIQASQMWFDWPPSTKFGRGSAFTTPTQTGLWDAVALSYWLMFTVLAGWWRSLFSTLMAVLATTGLIWSATRATVVAVAVELVVANAVLAVTCKGWLRRAVFRLIIGIVILGGVSLLAQSALQRKVITAISETRQTIAGDATATAEIRLAMWKMAWTGWKDHPLLGVGIGGIPESISKTTTVTNSQVEMKTVTMIHSTYLQALAETGVVGFTLLMAFVVSFFVSAFRSVRENPVWISSFGACVVWFTAAAFDGFQQSGGFLSIGAIVMVLACQPQTTTRPREIGSPGPRPQDSVA